MEECNLMKVQHTEAPSFLSESITEGGRLAAFSVTGDVTDFTGKCFIRGGISSCVETSGGLL